MLNAFLKGALAAALLVYTIANALALVINVKVLRNEI